MTRSYDKCTIQILTTQIPCTAHRKTVINSIITLIVKASTNKMWAAHDPKVPVSYTIKQLKESRYHEFFVRNRMT